MMTKTKTKKYSVWAQCIALRTQQPLSQNNMFVAFSFISNTIHGNLHAWYSGLDTWPLLEVTSPLMSVFQGAKGRPRMTAHIAKAISQPSSWSAISPLHGPMFPKGKKFLVTKKKINPIKHQSNKSFFASLCCTRNKGNVKTISTSCCLIHFLSVIKILMVNFKWQKT